MHSTHAIPPCIPDELQDLQRRVAEIKADPRMQDVAPVICPRVSVRSPRHVVSCCL